MRIMHICFQFAPRSNARNGGELRFWQNMASLVALGHEVHVVVCAADNDIEIHHSATVAATTTYLPITKRSKTRMASWSAMANSASALDYYLPAIGPLRSDLKNLANRLQPDLVWAEWIGGVALAPPKIPTVYSHHDFFYKIKAVRASLKGRKDRWPDRIRRQRLQQAEERLCRSVAHVVCVSASEELSLRRIATSTSYIPIVGPTIRPTRVQIRKVPHVHLFGNWNTAMRASVQHIRTDLWPLIALRAPRISWHQIGSPGRIDSRSWRWVMQHFHSAGFVEDLDTVFAPGDGSLAPYRHDTGFRTKFTTGAAYGLVNIGYDETFRCAPEFTPGVNCIASPDTDALADALSRFAADRTWRRQLSDGARELYQGKFSFEAQLPKYEEILDSVVTHVPGRCNVKAEKVSS